MEDVKSGGGPPYVLHHSVPCAFKHLKVHNGPCHVRDDNSAVVSAAAFENSSELKSDARVVVGTNCCVSLVFPDRGTINFKAVNAAVVRDLRISLQGVRFNRCSSTKQISGNS